MRGEGGRQSRESDRRQLDRVAAFSDGVFAVAITLLVLNIDVPAVETSDLGSALQDLLPTLQAYFIAFVVIGLFWYGHHLAWSHFTATNSRLVWVNMLLLSLIGLMPFTTALLGKFSDDPLATAVYALNVGLAAVADSLVDRVAWRDGLTEPIEPEQLRMQSIAGYLRPLVFFVSIPLAWISIDLAQFSWLLLIVVGRIAARGRVAGA